MKCDELKDYDYDPDFPFQSRGRFYDADEVDAAIDELKATHHKERHEYIKMVAELKEKLKEQTSIAEEGWKEFRTYHSSYAEAVKELYEKNKELRHQKYKRCLAMAMWCKSKSETYNEFAADAAEYMPSYEARFRRKAEHYDKWNNRWLKIANKFKDKETK